jgi:hypothetical protein
MQTPLQYKPDKLQQSPSETHGPNPDFNCGTQILIFQ